MTPDYVVSFPKRQTLHVAFHISNDITRVACYGTIWRSKLERWDYRYRGNGEHYLCRTKVCQEGFADLDASP